MGLGKEKALTWRGRAEGGRGVGQKKGSVGDEGDGGRTGGGVRGLKEVREHCVFLRRK